MLGLKLNHVSKRDHWRHNEVPIDIVIADGVVQNT